MANDMRSLLTNRKGEITYPAFVDESDKDGILIRRQVLFGPTRPALLIRHPSIGHLCGYVWIHAHEWERIRTVVRGAIWPRVTYEGPCTKFIGWAAPDGQGRLTNLVNLAQDSEDFWVGFDLMSQPAATVDEAYAILIGFENHIHRYNNDDLTA